MKLSLFTAVVAIAATAISSTVAGPEGRAACKICPRHGGKCATKTLIAPTELTRNDTSPAATYMSWKHTEAGTGVGDVTIDFAVAKNSQSNFVVTNVDNAHAWKVVLQMFGENGEKETASVYVRPNSTCEYDINNKAIKYASKLQLFGNKNKPKKTGP